jgi:hypothetical protein
VGGVLLPASRAMHAFHGAISWSRCARRRAGDSGHSGSYHSGIPSPRPRPAELMGWLAGWQICERREPFKGENPWAIAHQVGSEHR